MKIFLVVITLILTSSTAWANMRAPLEVDGDLIEARISEEASKNLVLTRELLTLDFPRLGTDAAAKAQIDAMYFFENGGETTTFDLVFFATDIQTATVWVNGTTVPANSAPMNEAQQAEFWRTQQNVRGLSDDELADMRRRTRYHQPQTSRFSVTLKRGENTIRFRYAQRIFINELSPRYGSVLHHDCITGVDYLLYPARSWPRADDFKLEIRMHVPDTVDQGWFFDDEFAPDLDSNVPMSASFDQERRVTTFRAVLSGFDVDIFSPRFSWRER